jgi:hypothetical protein
MKSLKRDVEVPMPTDPMWFLPVRAKKVVDRRIPQRQVPLQDPGMALQDKGLLL